jgi:hypothetical protein
MRAPELHVSGSLSPGAMAHQAIASLYLERYLC